MNLQRGDIVLVNLSPSKGSEQDKTRPALIIQNNVGNQYSPTTIIVPFTSSYAEPYPTDVEVLASESCLDKDSVAQCNQIRTVSIHHRIQRKLGSISDNKINQVDKAIKISLEL